MADYDSQYIGTQVDRAVGRVVGATAYSPTDFSGMGRVVLPKNIQSVSGTNKNVLTQAMMPTATGGNTVYVVQYDFTLSGNIEIPSNCVLLFDGGKISGSYTLTGSDTVIEAGLVGIFGTDITFAGTWKVKEVYPDWWGAKGDDMTDDTAAFTAMASFVTAMDGCRVFIPSKIYLVTSSFSMNGNIELVGTGDSSVIHIGNSSTGISIGDSSCTILDTTITTGDITIAGKTSAQADVTCSAVSPGTTTLTVSDASLFDVNGLYVIFDSCDFSFNNSRQYCRQGEIIRIKSKDTSNNTITLYNGLYGTYGTDQNFEGYVTRTNRDLFEQRFYTCLSGLSHRTVFCKFNFKTVNIRNLKILSEGTNASTTSGYYTLSVSCICNSTISGLNIFNDRGNHEALMINMAYQSSITDSRIYSDFSSGDDFYGLSLTSIQHFTVRDVALSGRDHSIATGTSSVVGKIVNRDFIYDRISVDSVGSNEIKIDVHDGAERYILRNIDFPTYSCDTGGFDMTIENCNFNQISTAFHGAGMKIRNCHCKSIGDLLSFSNPWHSYSDDSMIIEGSVIGGGGTCLSLNGQDQKYEIGNLTVRNCILNGVFQLRYNIAQNITIEGNTISSPTKCIYYYDRRNGENDTIIIRNNKLVAGADAAVIIGYAKNQSGAFAILGNCIIQGNVMQNDSSASYCIFGATLKKCIITDNWINQIGTTTTTVLFNMTDSEAYIDRNIVENVSKLLEANSNKATYNVLLGQNNKVTRYSYIKSGTGVLNVPVNIVSNSSSTLALDGVTPIHIVTTSTDITNVTLSTNPAEGQSSHVIFTSSSTHSVSITYNSTDRITPKAEGLNLIIPVNGYVEVDFISANGKVYVRGV